MQGKEEGRSVEEVRGIFVVRVGKEPAYCQAQEKIDLDSAGAMDTRA